MVSFFTLIIFFRENKLFQRGWGVFVLLCGDSRGGEGGGDHLFLAITNMENQGGGGGGSYVKFPLWWGMDIFGTTQYEICMLILRGL